MSTNTAGESLLRLLCDGAAESPARAPMPSSFEQWSAVVDEAVRHGVAPLLHRRLKSVTRAEGPSAPAIERLRDVYLHNALRNLTLLDELRQVLVALRHDGIPVVVLKGAHLAEVVYGDPALRPMVDIDLLVRQADLARVERSLNEMGYRGTDRSIGEIDYATHHHMHPLEKRGAIPVEVHRSIVPAGSPFCLDLERVWGRTREACIAGTDVRVLSPEDLVQHLCVHASYNHRFDISLLTLCDIATAIRCYRQEIDWPRLAAVANADGTGRFLYCALSLVQATVMAEIPPFALNAFQHAVGDDEVVGAARDCILSVGVELPIAWQEMKNHDGFRRKLRVLVQGICPSRRQLRAIYGLTPRARAVYWYYPIRLIDLVRRRGRVLGAIMLRTPRMRRTLEREERRRAIDRWIDRPSDRSPIAP